MRGAFLVFSLAFVLATSFAGSAHAARKQNNFLEGDFEKYAVRVSPLSRANRRNEASRGRIMRETTRSNVCGNGLTMCGTTCTNVTSDASNCGACFSVCSYTEDCCGGVCQDLRQNSHCGGCGKVCASPNTCEFGQCLEDLILKAY